MKNNIKIYYKDNDPQHEFNNHWVLEKDGSIKCAVANYVSEDERVIILGDVASILQETKFELDILAHSCAASTYKEYLVKNEV